MSRRFVCTDITQELVNQARQAPVDRTLALPPYAEHGVTHINPALQDVRVEGYCLSASTLRFSSCSLGHATHT